MALMGIYLNVNIAHLSDYLHWDQLSHAENWLLFEKNLGAYVCIDKVALSRGEFYAVLINKEVHSGKGSIIGIIKGTDVCTVNSVLLKLSRRRRYQVREITLDMEFSTTLQRVCRSKIPSIVVTTFSAFSSWQKHRVSTCLLYTSESGNHHQDFPRNPR